jgi:hypothetical protein
MKACPVCGVAMLAGKSNEDIPTFDTFHCLSCQTIISFASVPKPQKRMP